MFLFSYLIYAQNIKWRNQFIIFIHPKILYFQPGRIFGTEYNIQKITEITKEKIVFNQKKKPTFLADNFLFLNHFDNGKPSQRKNDDVGRASKTIWYPSTGHRGWGRFLRERWRAGVPVTSSFIIFFFFNHNDQWSIIFVRWISGFAIDYESPLLLL